MLIEGVLHTFRRCHSARCIDKSVRHDNDIAGYKIIYREKLYAKSVIGCNRRVAVSDIYELGVYPYLAAVLYIRHAYHVIIELAVTPQHKSARSA